MFVDSHAHLDAHYYSLPVDAVIERAFDAGVSQMMVVGCGLEASRNAVELARSHPGRIFAVAGVHPHDAGSATEDEIEALGRLARSPEVVGIGETGLDYHYDRSPRKRQREVFERFLDISREVDKPVVIHTREAEKDTFEILRRAAALPASGVFHCFTGSTELARFAVDQGMFVSFSGVLTFKNAERLRRCARDLPLDRLLIETDCPFMAPSPYRGLKNEPMLVSSVAGTLAAEKGLPLTEIAEITSRAARTVFRLPRAPEHTILAFAVGADLFVTVDDPSIAPERVLGAAGRFPSKKIKRVVLFRGNDAEPSETVAGAVREWAALRRKPVVDPS